MAYGLSWEFTLVQEFRGRLFGNKNSALEKEWAALLKSEARFLERQKDKKPSLLNEKLEGVECVPAETAVKKEVIRRTADRLSEEMLYMKFVQGLPVVGIVGGLSDCVYLKRITDYAELKYRRRMLWEKKRER